MAIAFDNAVQSDANSVTQNLYSHTCSGSSRILFVGVSFATGTDISGVPTYAGVNMVLVNSIAVGGTAFNKMYLYYLVNPASGANNVVINNTGVANFIYACSASYTGVTQILPIDASATNSAVGSSVTESVTTVSDNDWLVCYVGQATTATGNLSGGANTTARLLANGWNTIGDSNAAQTPPGSYSQTINVSTAELLGMVVAAFIPATATKVSSLATLGAGS